MAGSSPTEPTNSSDSDDPSSDSDSLSDSKKPHQPPLSNSSSSESDPNPDPRFIQTTGKRPSAGDDTPAPAPAVSPAKRVKKTTVVAVAAPDAEGEKKQHQNQQQQQQLLFQRLWSEENEIELIEGMIEYAAAKGKDPLADVVDFHEFVKKRVNVDVNDRQVVTKARRLKKKFENNVARESKGNVRTLSNPHEKRMYELSKSLWGDDGGNSTKKVKVKVKVNVTPKTNKSGKVVRGMPDTDEMIVEKGLELVSGAKRVEMEEKWKRLKVQELEHFLKKVEVLKEQAEVVLDAIAKSGAK